MSDLSTRSCTPCEGGTQPLDEQQVESLVAQVPGWETRGHAIEREFKFDNFHQTMAFTSPISSSSSRRSRSTISRLQRTGKSPASSNT